MRRLLTDEEYLWDRVHIPETPCWVWRGYIRDHGYGVWGKNTPGTREAHRRSYELLVGPIPEGMEVHHKCFNRSCVNPEHLELLSHLENCRQSRSVGEENRRKTHCKHGHPFDDENTLLRVGPSGQRWRVCKKCRAHNEVLRVQRNRQRDEYGRLDRYCKNGHDRTPENTYEFRSNGRLIRTCSICRREQMDRHNARRRERYRSDPAFRERQAAFLREWKQRKRAGE